MTVCCKTHIYLQHNIVRHGISVYVLQKQTHIALVVLFKIYLYFLEKEPDKIQYYVFCPD